MYPYDYSRLQKNEGLITLCIEKDKLIEYYKVDIVNRISESYFEREKIIKDKTNERLAEIDNEIRECKSKIEEIEIKTFNSLLKDYGIEKYFSEENLAKIKADYKELIANEFFKGEKKGNLLNDEKEKRLNLQLDFIRMLINKNYLDDNYLEYTSNNKSELSFTDREFIRNVKQGYVKTYNYKLENVNAVIINLNEEDFLQPAMKIYSLQTK